MNDRELFDRTDSLLKNLVTNSSFNHIAPNGAAIFDEPLIGVGDGRDPLFADYKSIIGDYYLTPIEAVQKAAELQPHTHSTQDVSVVCWVLPWAAWVREANANKTDLPASAIWSQAQETGEKLNNEVRKQVAQFFQNEGYVAAPPKHAPLYLRFGRYITNWSERHALYAAGMGTFGLSRWLITKRGVAMRSGSVVVGVGLPTSARLYRSHTENCLFYSEGSCRRCIDRCPAKAITVGGLDKTKCREYLDIHAKAEGCGLCQTNVPCEAEIPLSQRSRIRDNLEFTSISTESLDIIAPLWDKLRRYQEGRSPYFPQHYVIWSNKTDTSRRVR